MYPEDPICKPLSVVNCLNVLNFMVEKMCE